MYAYQKEERFWYGGRHVLYICISMALSWQHWCFDGSGVLVGWKRLQYAFVALEMGFLPTDLLM